MSNTEHTRNTEGTPSWISDPGSHRLGHFILGPELGRGGMGVVHRAWDDNLRREVALKLVSLPDPLIYLRFLREAEHQARVEHPHVCRVYEVGVEGDTPFIAMQLIQGGPLHGLRPDLPVRLLARLMAQAASALQAAHEAGLIHRDIKPANLLVEQQPTGGPRLSIVDFGLALDGNESRITLGPDSPGTPAYMSPEQAQGLEHLGPSSDIYSLGASFRPWFLGQDPPQALTVPATGRESLPPIARAGNADTSAPRRLHRDLEAILRQCLDPEPARRYPSARALQEDLDRWLEGRPTLARPLGLLGRIARGLRRRRALALALGFVTLCAALPAAWGLRHRWASYRQLVHTERFARDLAKLGEGLRKERMLPMHDIRPAEERLRARMEELRRTLPTLGPQAQEAGLTALGTGHFELGENAKALEVLDQAWAAGHRSPALAQIRGKVLVLIYINDVEWLRTRMEGSPVPPSQAKFRQERLEPAMAALREASSSQSEPAAYREAQKALLRGDLAACLLGCREAVRQAPWFYDALVLEGWVRTTRYMAAGSLYESNPALAREDLHLARKALAEAQNLAPSDARVRTILATLCLIAFSNQEAAGSSPEVLEGWLRAARKAAEEALIISPRSPRALQVWLELQISTHFYQSGRGVDTRQALQEARDRILLCLDGRDPDPSLRRSLANADLDLGRQAWEHGEDPTALLEEAARFFGDAEGQQASAREILALHALQSGRDPWRHLKEGEAGLERCLADGKDSPMLCLAWAGLLFVRHDAEKAQGRDPLPTLRRIHGLLRRAERQIPDSPTLLDFQLHAHHLELGRAEALGEDAQPALQALRTHLQRAGKTQRSRGPVLVAMAEACLYECPCKVSGGLAEPGAQEAAARLHEQARELLARALPFNPEDEHALQALLALERDEVQLASYRGLPPRAHLENASKAARKLVASQPRDAQNWIARSQTHSDWAVSIPADAGPQWALASACLDRAQALLPHSLHLRAERLLQRMLRKGPDAASLRKLRECLKANPFLGSRYRRYLDLNR